ncbi:MAG: hypothetical protein Q7S63_00335 [bacterium]|nr:hypothetical protein [bacterium]
MNWIVITVLTAIAIVWVIVGACLFAAVSEEEYNLADENPLVALGMFIVCVIGAPFLMVYRNRDKQREHGI